ncbi:MAG: sugar ABC transporter ATP-binding protein [Pseudomonadota bacterium]
MEEDGVVEAAIRIAGLRKAFGRNQVLRGVDLVIPAGQVTVLMGANGAGKSTLVKILCGVHAADSGEVRLAGAPHAPRSPAESLRAGVVTVHQSINDGVAADLDVASNLMLDHLASGAGVFLNGRRLRERARAIAAEVGLAADMRGKVADLSLADRQLVSIARAMAQHPKVLILDEPTSSLSAAETERLFALIDRFRAQGVAILYISHRMSDIRRLADRIVSMRDGAIAGTFEGKPLDYSGAVRAMLGHEMTEAGIVIPEAGPVVLEVEGLVLKPGARPFDLVARENEVVAITGLVGSGKTELASTLFGLSQPLAGRLRLDGRPYAPRSAAEAIGAGVFLSAKDRLTNAVVSDFDITRNLTLPFTDRHSGLFGLIRRRSEGATAARMIEAMGIVCQSARDGILTLSGGNQQKVVVGRWMAEASRLLILDEPFQGVDIKARRDIGRRIRDTGRDRATLVMVAELDEALEVADRVLVMSEHSIVGEHRNETIDVAAIMAQVVEAAQGTRAG